MADGVESPFTGEVEAERVRVEKLFDDADDMAAIEARLGKADDWIEADLPIPPGWCGNEGTHFVQVYAHRYSRLSTLVDVNVIAAESGYLMALAITAKVPTPPEEPEEERKLPALLVPETGCVGMIL